MNKDKSEDKKESPQNQSNLVPTATQGSSLNQQETKDSTSNNKKKKIPTGIVGYLIKFQKIVSSNVPLLTLFVLLIYTIFAGRQWCTMEKQSKTMEIQSLTMEEQSLTMKEQLVIGERAWVTVEKVSFEEFNEFNGGDKITVFIKIINAGKTPAFNTIVKVEVNFIDPSWLLDSDSDTLTPGVTEIPIRVGRRGPSTTVIGPNGEREGTITWSGVLTDDIIKLAKEEKMPLYVWGVVEYKDVFEIDRKFHFCFSNNLNTSTFKECGSFKQENRSTK